ncbi:MAG: urease accessory protein UreF [Oceanospirillaceae bacterium]|nr:urease accessory protein UreF [Oceanospirillaceae bacterium]
MSGSFFRLQQLISPSLPIGAFTYSQGLEWAVECGWVSDAEDLYQWLDGLLDSAVVSLDLPLLLRLYQASAHNSYSSFGYWSEYLLACRETRELRAEEQQRGQALLMVLDKLPDSAQWPELVKGDGGWREAVGMTQLSGFALACQKWQITPEKMLQGYLWSWLENMVIVAVKLIPLGQSDGQRVLFRFSDRLTDICEQGTQVRDEDIGAASPAMAIASSLHETQYCRLFRS